MEQNRLARVLWEQLEIRQHRIAQLNRARFGESSERFAGQSGLFHAATDVRAPRAVDVFPLKSHTCKGRTALPKDLQRAPIEYDLGAEQKSMFNTLGLVDEERSEGPHHEPSCFYNCPVSL
ncbi:hypothetical protein [Caballeronia sp. LjRoot29]|uniref:IS66 family transposase n=1 Tax=Caballeronia sp. LjRoot29 TaxID=3342315 RepID=UPI003F505F49